MIVCQSCHAELMAELHRRCFADSWDAQAMAGLLANPGTFGFLCVDGDDPLGLVLCRVAADECEILTISVVETARRKGNGARLLDAAQAKARKGGARHMFLEVGAANTAARSLYEDCGFTLAGRRGNYYRNADGKAEDALVLRLNL